MPITLHKTKKGGVNTPPSFRSIHLQTEAGLGLRNNLHECRFVEHGDIGQYFAIQIDLCLFQTVHEYAVAHALLTGSRIDTSDPQRTELTLALTTVTVGILACLHHRFFGDTVNVLVARARRYTTFYSWHGLLLMRKASWRALTPCCFREHQLYHATDVYSLWSSWSRYGA